MMDATLKNRSEYTISFLFFLTIAIVGVIGVNQSVGAYAKSRASASWPAVDAIVLSAGARDKYEIRYTYSFQGEVFESARINVIDIGRKDVSTLNEPGKKIRVYVNPKNHSFAVLNTGGGDLFLLSTSIIFAIFVFFGFGGIVRVLFRQYELSSHANESPFPAE